jgi:ABC-type nitrate/sulfonate/bicarbonate transport system substrate-binding protein
METREISKSVTTGLTEAKRRGFSRRSILSFAGAIGAAAPFGIFGAARALTTPPYIPDNSLICRAAASGEELQGAPRQLKLAWNANAACTVAAPVAKERGIFAKHNLDVEFFNFGGSTDQLLEAIATGKADAGLGLALRWLKPSKASMFGSPPGCTAAASGSSAQRLRISTILNLSAARLSGLAIRRALPRTSSRSSLPKRASIRPRR